MAYGSMLKTIGQVWYVVGMTMVLVTGAAFGLLGFTIALLTTLGPVIWLGWKNAKRQERALGGGDAKSWSKQGVATTRYIELVGGDKTEDLFQIRRIKK